MKKTLKSIQSKYGMLNEAYAWERTPGKALPTLEDVQNNYNAKSVNEQQQAPIYKAMGEMVAAQRDFEKMSKLAADAAGYGRGDKFEQMAVAAFKKAEKLLYAAGVALEEIAPGEG